MPSVVVPNRKSAFDIVIEALREYIIKNDLGPGSRLPSEQVLCESLGVSRVVLREAMRFYRTLGIIQSKPKLGAVIRQLHPDNPFQGYMPFMLHDHNAAKEVLELRMTIEIGGAELFCRKCTDKDIHKLRELIRKFEQLDFQDPNVLNEMIKIDIMFHYTLCKTAQNKLFKSLLPLTVDFFATIFRNLKSSKNISRIIKDHQEIVDALEERNVDALQNAINNHYATGYKTNGYF